MKLGIMLNYATVHERDELVAIAREAEDLGYDSLWASEAYSFDVFTTLTHLACHTKTIKLGTNIAQLFSRTPAALATTAASLDQISDGRFILGIGASGPQVIEDWHGVPYQKPVQRTREIIDIVRQILSGEKVKYDGEIYKVGTKKQLKIINPVLRKDLPIYVASLGPKNVEMTAELADGWLPTFFSTEHAHRVFGPMLEAGRAKRSPDLPSLEVAPFVPAFAGKFEVGIDMLRQVVGFYIGGMGSKEKNFYNQLVQRYGYVEEAQRIQEMFLGGQKQEAIAATPDELVDQVSLIGDEPRLRDRLQAFADAGATAALLGVTAMDPAGRREMLETIARANS
ncbi:MAG: LLM class F420-dependent oxidoreductase [Actinomycetota bacterium]